MNWGLILLLFIFLGLIFTVFFIAFFVSNSTPTPIPDTCQIPKDLIDISGLSCCQQGTVTTSFRYVPSLGLTVAPYPTYYLNVCQEYCQQGLGSSGTCINDDGTDNFNSCITKLKPDSECPNPAKPVAISNGQLYYGVHIGTTFCPQSVLCS